MDWHCLIVYVNYVLLGFYFREDYYYYFATEWKNVFDKHIKMVNLYEVKLIAGKKGIKNYKNMSREKLLSTLNESEHNFKNILQNGLEQISKMQNLSENELEQITKMMNLSQNELEQIAKMRHIKNYRNMSKEELLITFLKPEHSQAEL